jgi:hypothetical protein
MAIGGDVGHATFKIRYSPRAAWDESRIVICRRRVTGS